jgi:hypothetical protein
VSKVKRDHRIQTVSEPISTPHLTGRPTSPLSPHARRHHRTPPNPSVPKPYYPVATGEAPAPAIRQAAGFLGGSRVLAELLGAGGCPARAEAGGARAVSRRRPGRPVEAGVAEGRRQPAARTSGGQRAGAGDSGLQPAQQR